MRPGRPADVAAVIRLWQDDVAAGRQDALPGEARLRGFLERFDWEARSRVVEESGRITGAALVSSRASPDGVIASLLLAGAPEATGDLVRWAMGLSRAGGARIVQLFTAKGSRPLEQFGLHVARPWLRMDRTLEGPPPEPIAVAGYRLADGFDAPGEMWAEMFNRSFADHWRFTPRSEEEIVGGKPGDLCLMAVTEREGRPAAITLGEIEEYGGGDPRLQPVGLVSSVGTVSEHRRRGLAGWLVAEILLRLRARGARTASLYVDGNSQTRAFDVYRKLGFEVTYEAEVWEGSFP